MPTPLIGTVETSSPSMNFFKEGSGEYVTNKSLLPDMWWVVPLSNIIVREADMRGEHGIDLITRATTLSRGNTPE